MESTESPDTFRMNPISLGALIGALLAFVMVGAITDVIWVAIGGAIGGGIGLAVRRYARGLRQFQTAIDLREEASTKELQTMAQQLGIPGRSSMTRDELAAAIAERRAS